ncbi:D-alanyl-D-alanine carboxypeptidase [Aquibacillus sp. 3ASR75-11]|uniref:serine-type D-Ala-D-Ala carboxypeptidase n=1 Tax=Terrihalobacillus insolitus TaxID=2950438 RepID=A0A9X3WSD1_9BACI|nr:D-alanyl-D-alanine carboxypeptidase family protein [Terrihalobacillus insolitus]MDC3413108.1 D-alanyl-D-alanine carboxypeptidase [Terrihalobacillus insolitus]MDC3424850.1 D-alanyl-D-alanine carboxypeptidase [Terrihalobacillus insolitus]
MQKCFLSIIIFFLIFSYGTGYISAKEHQDGEKKEEQIELTKYSQSAILLERDTGKIMYEKGANDKLPPASMTKIMTLILIMEALDKGTIELEEKVSISEYAASMGGSQIFLEAGEKMTVKDLLKGVAVASGNDASVALAERIAGSEEAFVKMMNEKARELNLENTHFENPTGLPAENHYSTAYDMAIMARELLKHEEITSYTSIYEDYLRKGTEDEFWLVNTNKLVKFYDGVDGLKTGYTTKAKYCLTATAERNDMRVIAVVMGADTTKKRNSDVTKMLDYAFNQYETKKLFERNQAVSKLDLLKANKKGVKVVTGDSVSLLHKKGEKLKDIQTNVQLNENIELPLAKGDQVGILSVVQNGKTLSKTPLVVQEDVGMAGFWMLFKETFDDLLKKEY